MGSFPTSPIRRILGLDSLFPYREHPNPGKTFVLTESIRTPERSRLSTLGELCEDLGMSAFA